ncbi:hypothetical protein DM860_012127 [Cuscuta australis]|uniref:Uncharacterized protein n=1 Tax=Cuscuta australis TaxID=267555 RepID=A0A328DA32_9ASTE|nr:hypothetical protein DM860_012127 [Cuscuta australis]
MYRGGGIERSPAEGTTGTVHKPSIYASAVEHMGALRHNLNRLRVLERPQTYRALVPTHHLQRPVPRFREVLHRLLAQSLVPCRRRRGGRRRRRRLALLPPAAAEEAVEEEEGEEEEEEEGEEDEEEEEDAGVP